jgi:hypothetical protein
MGPLAASLKALFTSSAKVFFSTCYTVKGVGGEGAGGTAGRWCECQAAATPVLQSVGCWTGCCELTPSPNCTCVVGSLLPHTFFTHQIPSRHALC